MELDAFFILSLDSFGGVLDSDGGTDVGIELIFGESEEDIGLADSWGAQEHEFEHVVTIVHLREFIKNKWIRRCL